MDFIMVINITSISDCQMLISRLRSTLEIQKPDVLQLIDQQQLPPFVKDDLIIFEGLCKAIFSSDTGWDPIETKWEQITQALEGFDVALLSQLTENELCEERLKPLGLPIKPKQIASYIKLDAEQFINIQKDFGHFWQFIYQLLTTDKNGLLVIAPEKEAEIISDLTFPGKRKLHGVGLAIFSEFCKNIGIDEFKADRHVIRFFRRLKLFGDNKTSEESQILCRDNGIQIAETLGMPRFLMDSLIWNYCADKRGEICRNVKRKPKCAVCDLRNINPVLCEGPSKVEYDNRKRKIRSAPMSQMNQSRSIEILLTQEEYDILNGAAKDVFMNSNELVEYWIKKNIKSIKDKSYSEDLQKGSVSSNAILPSVDEIENSTAAWSGESIFGTIGNQGSNWEIIISSESKDNLLRNKFPAVGRIGETVKLSSKANSDVSPIEVGLHLKGGAHHIGPRRGDGEKFEKFLKSLGLLGLLDRSIPVMMEFDDADKRKLYIKRFPV